MTAASNPTLGQVFLMPHNAVQRATIEAIQLAFPWINPNELNPRILDGGSISHVEIKFVEGTRGYLAVDFSYMWTIQGQGPMLFVVPGWNNLLPTDPTEIIFGIGEAVQVVKTRPWATETNGQFTQVAFLRSIELKSRNGFPLVFPIGTHAVLSPSRRAVMPQIMKNREREWIHLADPFPTDLNGVDPTRNRWSVKDALDGEIK